MTYHMSCNQTNLLGRVEFDPRVRFPFKLWDVVNDTNSMIRWSEDGKSIVVHEAQFEKEVLKHYHGFVQVASFANLRRLLREYGFDWKMSGDGLVYEFSHPCFRRDCRNLLPGIKTKRISKSNDSPYVFDKYMRKSKIRQAFELSGASDGDSPVQDAPSFADSPERPQGHHDMRGLLHSGLQTGSSDPVHSFYSPYSPYFPQESSNAVSNAYYNYTPLHGYYGYQDYYDYNPYYWNQYGWSEEGRHSQIKPNPRANLNLELVYWDDQTNGVPIRSGQHSMSTVTSSEDGSKVMSTSLKEPAENEISSVSDHASPMPNSNDARKCQNDNFEVSSSDAIHFERHVPVNVDTEECFHGVPPALSTPSAQRSDQRIIFSGNDNDGAVHVAYLKTDQIYLPSRPSVQDLLHENTTGSSQANELETATAAMVRQLETM